MTLSDLTLQERADAARELVLLGEDPYDMLSIALWGECYGVLSDTQFDYCRHGHPLNDRNLYIRKNGWRVCRACANTWKRENKERLGSRRETA